MTACKILVVEDDKAIARYVQETLNRLGYDVVGTTATGEEAIKRAGEMRPGLVLMDITLAGILDGIQAAEQISRVYDIPIVYMTAHTDERTMRRGKGPSYGYVYKPIRDRELHAAIEVALDRHSLESRLRESQRWLSATLHSISEAVVATDPQGHVKFMSAMAEMLSGVKQEQALGPELEKVFPFLEVSTGAPAKRFWERYVKEEEFGYQRFRFTRDGREVIVGCRISSIRDDRQKPMGIVMVIREAGDRGAPPRAGQAAPPPPEG
jgi:PAS domain S-box-containing protein